jgi:hypothetical protein
MLRCGCAAETAVNAFRRDSWPFCRVTSLCAPTALHDTWMQALKSGAVKKNAAADESTAGIVDWEPITPNITKEDFVR